MFLQSKDYICWQQYLGVIIDITTIDDSEIYRLLEIHFKDDLFDEVEVLSVCEYR